VFTYAQGLKKGENGQRSALPLDPPLCTSQQSHAPEWCDLLTDVFQLLQTEKMMFLLGVLVCHWFWWSLFDVMCD